MMMGLFISLLMFVVGPTTTTAFQTVSSKASCFHRSTNSKVLFSGVINAPPTTTTKSTTTEQGNHDNNSSLEMEPENEKETFNWFKAWYPVVPVEILDPEIPHKFQLLGMDLVVWNDAPVKGSALFGPKNKKKNKRKREEGGQWRAFLDECPHRKVPLSEGRVENDGSLLCSYHGWRFNGEGSLIDIPQLEKTDELALIQRNPKSTCNSFPTRVINGLLWVWPETGSDARIESAFKEPIISDASGDNFEDDDDRLWVGPWNFRELPYGADYFLENVVDPAHVPVSHHNVIGSRYDDLTLRMNFATSLTKDGFSIEVMNPALTSSEILSTTTFKAPNLVQVDSYPEKQTKQTLELYVSPSRPGFCNHVGRMVILKPRNGKMPPMFRQFTLPFPKWFNHVLAASFLNQDGLFLHHQERNLDKTGAYSTAIGPEDKALHYTKAVLPVSTDKGVLNFRNWLRLLAGGRIPYKNNLRMPPANNEVVFNQYEGHTKYCVFCQNALANLKKARFIAFFAATCLAILRPTKMKIVHLAGVSITAGIGLVFNKLIGMFYRNEFSHAHND